MIIVLMILIERDHENTPSQKIVLTVSTSCQELSTPGSGSLKVNFNDVHQIYPYPVNTAGFVNP